MPDRHTVLFDLDGTLIDGGAGQLASLAHACRALGLSVPPTETLRSFIGPPFDEGFGAYFGLDAAACARAVAAYRTYYVDGGAMLEATLYPGIDALIDRLLAAGCRVALATSKPTPYARTILEHLGVAARFSGLFGADLAGERATKAEVVGEACFVLECDPADTVMVGDTEFDVFGARAHGLDCVGVLWGIGSRAELEAAGARWLAAAPDAVAELIGA